MILNEICDAGDVGYTTRHLFGRLGNISYQRLANTRLNVMVLKTQILYQKPKLNIQCNTIRAKVFV